MSAVLSAVLASHYLDQAGLLLLTGNKFDNNMIII
jgi:hypothetical protein